VAAVGREVTGCDAFRPDAEEILHEADFGVNRSGSCC
jgi:hypothetical protein